MNVTTNKLESLMNQFPISTEENKLLTMAALLSNYDLFSVQVNGAAAFHATKITLRKDRFIEFGKLFAVPCFTDGKVISFQAEANNTFTVRTNFSTYTIRALHEKPEQLTIAAPREWKQIADLMDGEFFGSRLNKIMMDKSAALLVVDPYLLGELTELEQYQIQRIINVYLDGKRQSLQIPRTIYFKVPFHCAENRIFAGVYDLAAQKPITEKLIYEQKMMEEIAPETLSKYQMLFYKAAIAAYGKAV